MRFLEIVRFATLPTKNPRIGLVPLLTRPWIVLPEIVLVPVIPPVLMAKVAPARVAVSEMSLLVMVQSPLDWIPEVAIPLFRKFRTWLPVMVLPVFVAVKLAFSETIELAGTPAASVRSRTILFEIMLLSLPVVVPAPSMINPLLALVLPPSI